MFNKLLSTILGSKNKRELKRIGKLVNTINQLESGMNALSDEALTAKTDEFKKRLCDGETLNELLPEAFAVVREASKRALGLRHFDVQMIGGVTLHEGRIAEMRTGEGKTLVATLPAYLRALAGSVHIVTVNDYLASRDAKWMAPIYKFLGMSVGIVHAMQSFDEKQMAYRADITYGTNNEFGFDYLRDNMALSKAERVQRPLHFAIVDEVDSILIDEARTPLIISGQADNNAELYRRMNDIIPKLSLHTDEQEGDYIVDEKQRQVELTEIGHQYIEELLIKNGLLDADDSLYATANLNLLHHVHSALRAHSMLQKNVDYIVANGEILLIDEHTGRTMPGRRLSEGLHQAIEAKEGVSIQSESQTLASTTFQNYFRLYPTLSGMTGTADTEAFEFRQIYNLDVVVIPTNKAIARQDLNDLIYLSIEEKYDAVVEDIKKYQKKHAPILVGTASVESSEALSKRLKRDNIKHNVLNAKFHEKEAEIIAQAGRPGAVTIATNMAGRGTDIVLGGNLDVELSELGEVNEEKVALARADWQQRHDMVMAAGGLHILGTERHESRRIDNQLRGRAGRQGDPGLSCFYLSMEDNLMRIFASDRIRGFMQNLGMDKGEAIEHRMVTNAIEKAQRKVEGRNFDIRKQLLEFDDVANDQRQVIYNQRTEILDSESIRDVITNIRYDVVSETFGRFIPPQSMEEQWDIEGLQQQLDNAFDLSAPIHQWLEEDSSLYEETLREKVISMVQAGYDEKCERLGEGLIDVEKQVMLQVLDMQWKEHLLNMDHLRQGIGLRAYAQRNPKQEYKRESFELFQVMLQTIKEETIRILARVEPVTEEEMAAMEEQRRQQMEREMQLQHAQASVLGEAAQQSAASEQASREQPFVRHGKKVGRNEACPCNSGKKYKQCHGKL
ncbi:preprotein translocase subunit SecA [Candidatus Endobugula sertula]|uniref:Protein translocase subunit SecA n=1 Tax=Candidatus Endobugula sertula TaxID=62101 RepID=A0A1D2QTL6_9GAMM|nr:preprotein translocase subunit SecA [Candidatus Endobugula sertula]